MLNYFTRLSPQIKSHRLNGERVTILEPLTSEVTRCVDTYAGGGNCGGSPYGTIFHVHKRSANKSDISTGESDVLGEP